MENKLIQQLADLAESFAKIGLQPVICGGLGIYLCFYKNQGDAQQMIRTTNDIDLMLTATQVFEQSRCRVIAELITGELDYSLCEDGQCFRFKKEPDQRLDVLAPPVNGFNTEGGRVKFVKSILHGRLTNEACFIEEDLRTISLSAFFPDDKSKQTLAVMVPSPTNLLIMKLFAFNDRNEPPREDTERAQAQAWDIYITIMLADRNDYLQGQKFLQRHRDSDIIRTAQSIVRNKFSTVDQPGWRSVLQASDFYPDLNRQQKEAELETAKARLLRWFNLHT